MITLTEKLKKLKETHPAFKDYDFKIYHNDLTDSIEYIEKRLKEKEQEELLEEKRILELNVADNNTKKSSE